MFGLTVVGLVLCEKYVTTNVFLISQLKALLKTHIVLPI